MARTPNNSQGVPSFVDLGKVYLERQDSESFMAICTNLDRLRDAVQTDSGAGTSQGRTVVVVQQPGGGPNDNQNTPNAGGAETMTIKDCTPMETDIALWAAVFVDENKGVYLATAGDYQLPCTGIVTKVSNQGMLGVKVDVQAPAGITKALLTDMVSGETRLWLSTTRGRLTTNYNQTGAQIVQECGTFLKYSVNSLNQTVTTVGDVSLAVSSAVPTSSV